MAEIIPSILEQDFKVIAKKISQVEGLANWVQLDIVDGLFAPSYTWEACEDLNQIDGKIKIEAHLMVEQPEQYLVDWARVVDRIIVHHEATDKVLEIVEKFEHLPLKIGVALLLKTPVEVVKTYVDKVDLVQLMSIEKAGTQGQELAIGVVEKIKELKKLYPKIKIAVDGGINLKNAKILAEAGADNLIVGSAIWKSADVAGEIAKFQKIIS